MKKPKIFVFKPFCLMTEKRSKERKTQSFYTPAATSNLEKKKLQFMDKSGHIISFLS